MNHIDRHLQIDFDSGDTGYSQNLRTLLFELLCDVIRQRAPDILPVFLSPGSVLGQNAKGQASFLHATTI